jgi:hypothetical protein
MQWLVVLIRQVLTSWAPVDVELALLDSIFDTVNMHTHIHIHIHCHCPCSFLFYGVLSVACSMLLLYCLFVMVYVVEDVSLFILVLCV